MIEPRGTLARGIQYARHARGRLDDRARRAEQRRVVHVDMGDLVVGDGEDPARTAIEQFESEFVLDREPTLRPEHTIQGDRTSHRGDAVFREHEGAHPALFVEIDQSARHAIDGAQIIRQPVVARALQL